MFQLTGKTALVTGASRGLGMGIAKCLAQAGADVVVNYHSAGALAEQVVQEITGMGRKALAIKADVSNEEDVRRMTETVQAHFGGIDILVNNAGINSNYNIDTLTLEEWDKILRTNLTSGFLCSKYALPLMREKGWGRIILISSLVGQQGALFGQLHYASTKGAQISFCKTLARTVALEGITVNCIAPGVHMTDTLEEILVKSDPHRMDATIEKIPMKKLGTIEDIGHAAVFLASEEAGYITGSTIDVNGGIYMR